MSDMNNDRSPHSRATSVDGFLSGEGQRPRQSAVRPEYSPASAFPSLKTKSASFQQPKDMMQPLPSKKAAPNNTVRTITNSDTQKPSSTTPQEQTLTETARPQEPKTPPVPAKPMQGGLKKPRKNVLKRILKGLGVIVLLGLLAFGGRFLYDLAKLTGNANPFALLGAFQKAPLKNENGRVNVLVAGNSADDLGHNGGELTDSIMVLSIDTRKNTAMMLSIPRDTWVNIPGEGHAKINAAYPSGGMQLLSQVVEDNLELPIHYTALVNYKAFKDAVDAVGGINITIKSSNPKGIYDSSLDWTSRTCCALAKYPNGPVTLNGQQALNLARARGEGFGSYGFDNADFTRTEHQRLMLLAIREKALSSETLSNPLKISNLVSAVGQNVKTDLELKEIQTLYSYAKDIDPAKIDSYNINSLKGEGTTMLQNYTSPDGQSALIPAAGIDDFSEIAAQIKRLFTASPVAKEAAAVVVLNATETAGLARTHASTLTEQGMSIAAQGNTTVQPAVTIVDNSKDKPNTIEYLKKKYNATVITDATMSANYPGADIILILGTSAVPKASTSTQ